MGGDLIGDAPGDIALFTHRADMIPAAACPEALPSASQIPLSSPEKAISDTAAPIAWPASPPIRDGRTDDIVAAAHSSAARIGLLSL